MTNRIAIINGGSRGLGPTQPSICCGAASISSSLIARFAKLKPWGEKQLDFASTPVMFALLTRSSLKYARLLKVGGVTDSTISRATPEIH